MKGLAQLCRIALGVAVLSLGPTAFGAFDEPGKLLFLNSYETLKTTNGSVTTHPASYAAGGNPIAGVIQGNAKLVEGKKGQSLELSGDSRVVYDHLSAINLFGGEASFWVKLNFDPNARTRRLARCCATRYSSPSWRRTATAAFCTPASATSVLGPGTPPVI